MKKKIIKQFIIKILFNIKNGYSIFFIPKLVIKIIRKKIIIKLNL